MEATLSLADPSGVADSRRQALHMAGSLGFPEKRQADVALIVTELATNILKYARHGEILLRSFHYDSAIGMEIIALDKGPGIANVDVAQADGYSTGGSLGAGLGTVARHSTAFDVYSVPGNGTAVLSRISAHAPCLQRPEGRFSFGVRSTPKKGQDVCGDAWAVRRIGDTLWVALLDGLGHGPLAAEASRLAVESFHAAKITDSPEDVLRKAHLDIKASRGAVMAVAMFDPTAATASFGGVGNIVAIVTHDHEVEHFLSTDGTVGYNMRTVRPAQSVWRPGRVFIATTDGLSTRWNLNRHPGLSQKHPSLIAAVLHRDFARDLDDATIIVVKAI